MKTTTKVIMSIIFILMILIVAICMVAAIWAAKTQTFQSKISVMYISKEVAGSSTAEYQIGESGVWKKMDTNGPQEGGEQIVNFEENTPEKQTLLPTDEVIELELGQAFVVFKYTFSNTAKHPYNLTLTNNETSNNNIELFSLVTSNLNGELKEVEGDFQNYITEPLKTKLELIVMPKSTNVIYILLSVAKTNKNAEFVSKFTFDLDGENKEEYKENFTYAINDENHIYLTGIMPNHTVEELDMTAINYKQQPISNIGAFAFADCEELSILNLQGVTHIGAEAFVNCLGLNEIVVPETMQQIDAKAFYGCTNLKTVTNFSTLKIKKHNTSNGYVAYYADDLYGNVSPLDKLVFTFVDNNHFEVKARSVEETTDEIIIPETYENENGESYPVTVIPENAFLNCLDITSITIPETITDIGKAAFSGLVNLTEINYNATNLNEFVTFEDLENIASSGPPFDENNIFYSAGSAGEGITLNFGDGVTHVPNALFCPQPVTLSMLVNTTPQDMMQGITLSEDVKNILDDAFNSVVNITEINFNNVQSVGLFSFMGALINMPELILPKEINCMNMFSFAMNSNFYKVYFDYFEKTMNGEIQDNENSKLDYFQKNFKGIKSITVQCDELVFDEFSMQSFVGNFAMQSVIFDNPNSYNEDANLEDPNGEFKIMGIAYMMVNIFQIDMDEESITELLSLNINDCYDVYVPSNVELNEQGCLNFVFQIMAEELNVSYVEVKTDKVGYKKYVASYPIVNSNPESISVTNLAGNPVESAVKGTKLRVTVTNPLPGYEVYADGAVYNSQDDTYIVKYNTEFYYTNVKDFKFTAVEGGYSVAARNTNISGDIEIPNEYENQPVISIAERGFYNCKYITSLVIPDNVATIGNSAFTWCENISKVVLGSGVSNIENSAFDGCYSLTEILNKSVLTLTIGSSSDGYVAEYAARVIENESEKGTFETIDDVVYYKYDNNYIAAYPTNKNITTLNLLSNTTEIKSGAFADCYNLKGELTLSQNLTKVGMESFCDCDGITSVLIPSSVKEIGDRAFLFCDGLSTVTLGNGLKDIGNQAFDCCYSLTEILNKSNLILSVGSTSYGNIAKFAARVITDESQKGTFEPIDDVMYYIYDDNYIAAYSTKKVTTRISLQQQTTAIKAGAFDGCYVGGELILPPNITSIGAYAFNGCDFVGTITIPESVTYIGRDAFSNCNTITSIVIKSAVTIEYYAFGYLTGLTNVTVENAEIYNSITGIDSCGCFLNNIDSGETIKVLKSIVDENASNEYLNNAANFTRTEDASYYIFTKV